MAQYGKTSYWDERYTKDPEPFDWYQRYSGIQELIAKYKRDVVIAEMRKLATASPPLVVIDQSNAGRFKKPLP